MSAIKRQDVIADDVFQGIDELVKGLEKVIETVKQLGKASGQGGAKKATDELSIAEKELLKITKQITVEKERQNPAYIQAKVAIDGEKAATKELVNAKKAEGDAYKRIEMQLAKARSEYKNMAAAGQANTLAARKLASEAQKLDRQLKKIDNTVGQNTRSVGKYTDALKGVGAKMLAFAGAGMLVVSALKDAVKVVLEYSKSNSALNAVLGVTAKQTENLRKQQKELGTTTAFSAKEVADAQIELAKLGGTINSIEAMTPSILSAATALQVDLASAAELVASQLNAFGLSAGSAGRVVDVLVKAANIGAFDFRRLSDSLSVVAPAAKAVGATIEETVAILGAAVDANIDASTAGTELRNIYLDLIEKGINWDDAMQRIRISSNQLATANELFGKRGAVMALVIANNTKKIDENTIALNNAKGAADIYAKEVLNNLAGDLNLLSKAWDGFVLSLESGEGPLARVSRAFTQWLTGTLNVLTQLKEAWEIMVKSPQKWADETWQAVFKSETMLTNSGEKIKDVIAEVVEGVPLEQIQSDIDQWSRKINRAFRDAGESYEDSRSATEAWVKITMKQKPVIEEVVPPVKKLNNEILDTADATKKAYDEFFRLYKMINKIKGIVPELPPKLSHLQEKMLELSEVLFGVSPEETSKKIEESGKAYLEGIGKRIKKTAELEEGERKKRADAEKQYEELKAEIISQSIDVSKEIFQGFTNLRIEQIQSELDKQEMARNRELEAAGDNERLKSEIDKKYDAKRRSLQRKQANAEKANALFNIGLTTAMNVVKALGTPPVPNFVLSGIAAAMGAAQAAFVASRKVPEFDKGTGFAPDQFIAGEKRPELMKHDGEWSLVDRPTLFTGHRGAKIVSGKETDSILGSLGDFGVNILKDKNALLGLLNNDLPERTKPENLRFVLEKNNKELIQAIQKKKEVSVNVNNRGARVRERSGNLTVDRINYYYGR